LDYRPYEDPTGTEALPNSCHQVGSGFVREKPLTIPTEFEVTNVAINTRSASAPVNIMPKYTPHLHKIQSKDPVQAENGGYVSQAAVHLYMLVKSILACSFCRGQHT